MAARTGKSGRGQAEAKSIALAAGEDGDRPATSSVKRSNNAHARVGKQMGAKRAGAGAGAPLPGGEEYVATHRQARQMDSSTREAVLNSVSADRVCSLLETQDVRTIVETMDCFQFNQGENVIQQGRTGQYFFVTEEGTLEVSMNGKPVNTIGKGSVFGGLALLYKCPRTATVTVKSASAALWGCSGDTFHRVIQENANRHYADNRRFLDSIKLFDGLSAKQKELVSGMAVFTEVVDEKARVVTQGEIATGVYFVKSGTLQVIEGGTIASSGDVSGGKDLRELAQGDTFGERAALYGEARGTTVVAKSRCELLCIGIKQLKEVLGEDIASVLERSLVSTMLRTSETFKSFPAEQRQALADKMQISSYKTGEVIRPSEPIRFVVAVDGSATGNRKNGEAYQLLRGGTEAPEAEHGDVYVDLQAGPQGVKLALLTKTVMANILSTVTSTGGGIDVLEHARRVHAATKAPIFRHLSEEQINSLVQRFKSEKYSKGDMVVRQGEPGTSFFVVGSGEVSVTIGSDQIRSLSRNAYFGERALLFDEPRTATVQVTSAEAELWSVDAEIFGEICANIREELIHKIRLQNTSVKLKDLKHVQIIGVGGMGSVRQVEHRRTGLRYALKRIKKAGGKLPEGVVRECQLLGECGDHPFVLHLVKTFETAHSMYILTELITGGELFSALRAIPTVLSRRQAMFYTGSLVLVMELLADRHIVFRDLKPENVMLDSQGYLKLIDFGIAKKLVAQEGDDSILQKTFTIVGTPHYMAPEVMRGRGYGIEVDIWSLGVMLFEFVCGYLPFGDDLDDPTDICTAVCSKKLEFPDAYTDQSGRKLMTGLLVRKPEKRLGAGYHGYEEIKEQKFFKTTSGSLFAKIIGREYEAPWIPPGEVYCDEEDAREVALSDSGELAPED